MLATAVLAASILAPPNLNELVDRQLGGVIEVYKWFHQNPELSEKEEKTAARFASELRAAGWKTTEKVGGHGVIGVLANGAGPTVLVRVDMDALPIQEETSLAYASKNGAMHACGHDIHLAAGLGVARALAQLRDTWTGSVVLIGQPAEEIGTGAQRMLDDAKLKAAIARPPVAALSMHDTHFLPAGAVAMCSGECTAYVDQIEVTMFGRGGHSSTPQKAIDPILMAAELTTSLQSIANMRLSPTDRANLGVNAIHAGNKNGIIPDKATLLITARAIEAEAHETLLGELRHLAARIAEAHHAPRAPEIKIASSYIAGVQDPELVRKARDILKPAFGDVPAFQPLMVGEDFFAFGRYFNIPALQIRVGAVPPRLMAPGAIPPSQHSNTWAPEPEPTLRTGVLALTKLCLGLLAEPHGTTSL